MKKSSIVLSALSTFIISSAALAIPPGARGLPIHPSEDACENAVAADAAKAAHAAFHPIYIGASDEGEVPFSPSWQLGSCSTRQIRDAAGLPPVMGIVAPLKRCGMIYTFSSRETEKAFAKWVLASLKNGTVDNGGVPICTQVQPRRVGMPIRPLINGIRVPR